MWSLLFVILALIIGLVLGYVGARKSMSETHVIYQRQIEEVRRSAQINAEQQQQLFQQQLATVRNELTGQTERLLRERSQQLTEENKNYCCPVNFKTTHFPYPQRPSIGVADSFFEK